MGKIISIAIQKGGCGKTSTTLCLASSLKEMGYKVLMVDLDPQGNLTYGSGVENVEKTIYNLLREQAESNRETDIKEVIVHSSSYNVDVIPANINNTITVMTRAINVIPLSFCIFFFSFFI